MTANQNEPFKKTFTLHGASVERMVWLNGIIEYDERGKDIYHRDSNTEERHDYDERGKKIRCTIFFFGCKDEFWYEYDYYDDGTVRRSTEYRTARENE